MADVPEQQQDDDGQERPSVVVIGKKLGKEFVDDDVMGLAAEVAYHAIFAIPAIIMLLVLIAAFIENYTAVAVVERMHELVDERAPGDTQEILNRLIDNAVAQVGGGLASIGILMTAGVALWSGSNGVASLMKAFNRAYDIEDDRPYPKKRLLAIGLTVLVGVLVNLAFVLFVFGSRIGKWLAGELGYGSAFEVAVNIARWPLGILFMIGMLAVLYYLAPNVEQSFRWISPGSVLATVLWVIAVLCFSIYLLLSDPGSAYGTLSSALVFLFFLYVTAVVLLIGAELNAILEKRCDPETLEDIGAEEAEAEQYRKAQGPVPAPSAAATGYLATSAADGRMRRQRDDARAREAVVVGLLATVGAAMLGRLGRRM